jgi:peroxiredoxin
MDLPIGPLYREDLRMSDFPSVDDLPSGLPDPIDDGACEHLPGSPVAPVPLKSSSGAIVDLSSLRGRTVVYVYPMSGPTNAGLPAGWDAIPGARGCTPQSCSFRDHHDELAKLGAAVFGLSTQTPDYLASEVARIHLPFDLLSDHQLSFINAMHLPTFDVEVAGGTVAKRVTLVLRDGNVEHVLYPVFPPNRSAEHVLEWLTANPN